MEQQSFDRFVRKMATGVSRRSVLRRAAGSAIMSPLALLNSPAAFADGKDKNKDKDKDKNKDRGNGGNVDADGGVAVASSGPAQATQSQQTVQTSNQVCAGDCTQTNQQSVGGPTQQTVLVGSPQVFGRPPSYLIDVSCQFDAQRYETICTCTSRGDEGAPPVRKITVPVADLCAIVVTEEMRPESRRTVRETSTAPAASGGQASAGNGGVANSSADGGSVTIGDVQGSNDIAIDASGGTSTADASGGDGNVAIAGGGQVLTETLREIIEPSLLTLTLEGNVVPGRPTTYWVDTDAGRRPASGAALVQVAEESPQTGTIVAEARICTIGEAEASYDWFGQCTAPATGMGFSLYPEGGETSPIATIPANAQGRATFGNLAPGVYQLSSEGTSWCYAESDGVDANGNVLVEADRETRVWTFACGAAGGS